MIFIKPLLFLSVFSLLILSSCKKDEQLLDSNAKIDFSTDEVLFDTVFHYAGSTTKVFRIYNRHKQPMNISKAYLAIGASSAFTINIDGVATTTSVPIIKNIEILGGDSLYVFVQVHVTPSGANPVIISDSIIFETNGNIQHVKLTAIGQDVYLHKPAPGKFYSITGRSGFDTILPNDKPHLVFGYAVIDSACKATIQPGTHFYMHNKAVLWVYRGGTLNIQGSHGNEVTFQGDRLEAEFKELPGQWGKIWLSQGSINNVINWAIIKNGSIGVQADTTGASINPTLQINNTIVKNMTAAAIFAQGSFIRSINCVFANCGQYVAALSIGGKYRFEQCTFANFWTGTKRTTPLLALNNYYISAGNIYVIRKLDSAYFGNCILYGSLDEELGIDSTTYQAGVFSYKFDHCILKTGLNTANGLHYNTVVNIDPGFKNSNSNNYQLTSTANAIDKGNTAIFISPDLNNQPRPNPSTSLPDLGAYEYYP